MSERITPPNGSVTLRDIAEQTGLSVSAVSMALQDHPRIGTETTRMFLRPAWMMWIG